MGCVVSPKSPPPCLPTSCSERVLSAGGPAASLPSPSPLSVSAPSRRGGLAALRDGVAIDKQSTRSARLRGSHPELGASPGAGRRPRPPGQHPPEGPLGPGTALGALSLRYTSPGLFPLAPPLPLTLPPLLSLSPSRPHSPFLGAPRERSDLAARGHWTPAPAVRAPK